jgi:hypothetical protein
MGEACSPVRGLQGQQRGQTDSRMSISYSPGMMLAIVGRELGHGMMEAIREQAETNLRTLSVPESADGNAQDIENMGEMEGRGLRQPLTKPEG